MKILIKGAGDIASGIACRLSACRFPIIMTETNVPTTVRRTVAFSRAVYEGRAEVENVTGILCPDLAAAEKELADGNIAVVVDEQALIRKSWKPDVMIDAILAKRNLGTSISDAPVVIGVGPGFTAGEDCHCVVETMRGHNLGRCLYHGSARPNTGIPGNIGGYTKERILRAPCDGIFRSRLKIGDEADEGETVGFVDERPMCSQIKGIVRGLLQDGVQVHTGMKAGDVDPRCEPEYCHTVSDKARAIAGAVLEAVLHLGCEKNVISSSFLR